jgi:hypothetical protein
MLSKGVEMLPTHQKNEFEVQALKVFIPNKINNIRVGDVQTK